MISKVIEHSTRKISFSADELKPWTKEDEELINVYIKLHDHQKLIQSSGKVLDKKTNLINDEIEPARQTLAEVAKEIKELSNFADTFILPNPKKKIRQAAYFLKLIK